MSSQQHAPVRLARIGPGPLGLRIDCTPPFSGKYPWISEVLPHSPLFRKVFVSDRIMSIGGMSLLGKSPNDVAQLCIATKDQYRDIQVSSPLVPLPSSSSPLQALPTAASTQAFSAVVSPTVVRAPQPTTQVAATVVRTATTVVPMNSPELSTVASSVAFLPQAQKLPLPIVAKNHSSVKTTFNSNKENVKPSSKAVNKKKKNPTVNKKTIKSLDKKPSKMKIPDLPEYLPESGFIDESQQFYSTLNDETPAIVAMKLGMKDNKVICRYNSQFYGALTGGVRFKANTILYFPKKHCSPWKLKQLMPAEMEEKEECIECGAASNPAHLLLCDGCDAYHHVACVGLTCVPNTDWFCRECCKVLDARRSHHSEDAPIKLPSLTTLPASHGEESKALLRYFLVNRRKEQTKAVREMMEMAKTAHEQRLLELEATSNSLRARHEEKSRASEQAQRQAQVRQNVHTWQFKRFGGFNTNYVILTVRGSQVKLYQRDSTKSPAFRRDWNDAYNRVLAVDRDANVREQRRLCDELLLQCKEAIDQAKQEVDSYNDIELTHRYQLDRIEIEHATLLGEPRLQLETTKSEYENREFVPRYLGKVTPVDDGDVMALSMLMEPDELILTVPADEDNEKFEPCVGRTFHVYCRQALFDKKRDDELPMNPTGLRGAQRKLFALLESENKDIVVVRPSLPPTVRLRKTDNPRCFDLSELVRDCNVDLDLPSEPTPPALKATLRDYQQSSLRWMLDKEQETTGLGLAGELWHRLRFMEGNADYFFCELTGSFCLDIFDYTNDIGQRDASKNRYSMPTGGMLGEEMGLGKTVIAIALMLANPPPLHRRALPREHLLTKGSDFPGFVSLPRAGIQQDCRISNGTLVIVPMTLLSQWLSEIKQFAPHLNVLTLHNDENPTLNRVAASDVVVASTYLLQQSGTKNNAMKVLRAVKKIHWHRVLVDEAHYNQSGTKIKSVIATLSCTHRFSITGTPIGSQLSDLYGQMRFLRIAPFDREGFWKNCIETGYYDRDLESLRVLRSLLSRTVIRHSKEQTFQNGKALLALPARTVETVSLTFGSDAEKGVYESIDMRNRNHYLKLKHEGMATVASNFIQLNSMMMSVRQACAHSSLIDLEKLETFNRGLRREKPRGNRKAEDNTRAGILQRALSKALPSAEIRMREVLQRFQEGGQELLECPVCLECVSETEICLPACAHPLCSDCMMSILDTSSSRREACGHCPTCRSIVRRSEITFLGEATDAGTENKAVEQPSVEDSKMPAVESFNGFQMTSSNVQVEVTGASTPRAATEIMTPTRLRGLLSRDRSYLPNLSQSFLSNFYTSKSCVGTKHSKLLEEIQSMIQKDSASKCVVFSQFLGVLDVAAQELRARGIKYVRIDGNSKQHERADSLLEFSSNPKIKVFLLSMRSGAVGLTLTAADNCFIMDLAQNSAIEEQAIDRIHRLGQTRPVTVRRFVMKNTVEERLLGVRRSLGVDRAAGTQICGASVLAHEEERPAKRARKNEDDFEDSKRQQRIQMLETLFGCSQVKVHKA